MENKSLLRLKKLHPLVNKTGDKSIEILYKFLYERISHPDSYVVFLGETSSGKTSIINSLLGEPVLPMKAPPTTAAITEIEFSAGLNADEYYAINKDATIEQLDKRTFLYFAEHPDENLSRLRLRTPDKSNIPSGCRIFDTPGYESILAKHEEVLKDFLPNSDIVVYTVSYRIGIQDSDYTFLYSLKELLSENTKIILTINRCPSGITERDRKVQSIYNTVNDLLGDVEPNIILIDNVASQEGVDHPLPSSTSLWKSLDNMLSSDDRKQLLEEAFKRYTSDLLSKCESFFAQNYVTAKADDDSIKAIIDEQIKTANKISKAVDELIIPTFDKLEKALPKKIVEAKEGAQKNVLMEIDNSSSLDKEEIVSFTNVHLIPHSIKTEMEEVNNYLSITLDDLNQKVNDYIQKEIISFRDKVQIILDTHVSVTFSTIIAESINNLGRSSLEGYFATFGGMGGANAGIANAASHLLKVGGDLFGKTFSRETHNAVKHFLSKIGATSMKAVGAAIAVVTEIGFMVYDIATWKHKLKNKVKEGLDKWDSETVNGAIKDLRKLRDENIRQVKDIAKRTRKEFSKNEATGEADKWKEALDQCKEIRKEIA